MTRTAPEPAPTDHPTGAARRRADLADVPLHWVLVAGDEAGLLHRLARVVRGTPGGVLVRLDRAPAGAPEAQVGVSPGACRGGSPAELVWLGGLTARDVALVAAWVSSGAPRVPDELAPRVVAVPAAGRRGATSRTGP